MRNLKLLIRKSVENSPSNTSRCEHCSTIVGEFDTLFTVDSMNETVFTACRCQIFMHSVLDGCEESRNPVVKLLSEDFRSKFLKDSLEPQVIATIHYLSIQQKLFYALTNGTAFTYDLFAEETDAVARVSGGIERCEFSPDGEVAVILLVESDEFVLVDGEFQVISEAKDIHPEGHGKDNFVTVGWGKKETQFQGSAGKGARESQSSAISGHIKEIEDRKKTISWRGDGQFFAISAVEPKTGARAIRIWTRDGVHSSTTEVLPGVGSSLSWRPSGNLITANQCGADGSKIIFFERNGLERGGFLITRGDSCHAESVIKEVAWNSASNILAVALQHNQLQELQFWTTSNYHWYLKHVCEIPKAGKKGALLKFLWDEEIGTRIHLMLEGGEYRQLNFGWIVSRSLGKTKTDPSSVAVIDGELQSRQLDVDLKSKRILKFSTLNSTENSGMQAPGSHLTWIARDMIGMYRSGKYHFYQLKEGDLRERSSCQLDGICCMATVLTQDSVLIQLENGGLVVCKAGDCSPVHLDSNKISPCSQIEIVNHLESHGSLASFSVLALSPQYRLFLDGNEIASNITSLALHDEFLLATTLAHKLIIAPLKALFKVENGRNGPVSSKKLMDLSRDVRALERGSCIVTCTPEDTKVVLQMPRGNLETIHPRALVIALIGRLLDRKCFRKAVMLMRKHRINLNLTVDHNPKFFHDHVVEFVESVSNCDYFNLFLSDLSSDDVTQTLYASFYAKGDDQLTSHCKSSAVDSICQKLRESMTQSSERDEYFNAILTSFLKESKPQVDKALECVQSRKSDNGDSLTVDSAIKHLLCLTTIDKLYSAALGTYDFQLVLMVLQRSDKDPKEYLPFLNELNKLEPNYMKFKIDVHLKRYEKALEHIHDCGEEKWSALVDFVVEHSLFDSALKLYPPDSTKYKVLADASGESLVKRGCFKDAGLIFEACGEHIKAVEAFSKTDQWASALRLLSGVDETQKIHYAKKIAQKLRDDHRFSEASLVYQFYAKDRTVALECLLEGCLWQEAHLFIAQHDVPGAIESLLKPSLLSCLERFLEMIGRKREQVLSLSGRLEEIRLSKKKQYEQFLESGASAAELEACELYSDVSTVSSMSSAGSQRSATALARKRAKASRKKVSLKKNTPYEDLAILRELHQIFGQVPASQDEVSQMLPVLYQLNLCDSAHRLQTTFDAFLHLIRTKSEVIWPEVLEITSLPGPLSDIVRGCDFWNDRD